MLGAGIRSIGVAVKDARAATRFLLVGALATAALLAGCGGASRPSANPSAPSRPDPALIQHQSSPRVGTTQRVNAAGAHLSVTVLKVVDLPSDDDAPVLPGFRGVGVKVEISNTGPADYDSLATSDFSIAATDPNIHLLYVPSGLCRTPPRDFDSHLSAGEHRRGCLAFRIHTEARVTEVRFSPNGKGVGQLAWGR
jgi:hypothetical protein